MKKLLALVFVLVLAGCGDETIVLPSAPEVPEPFNIAGSWTGSASWDAVQGGGATTVTSGRAAASVGQTGATISGTWEVPGLYAATFAGSIDAQGFIQGTTTVNVLAVPCTATSVLGGEAKDVRLVLAASFPGTSSVACAGAPVGLELRLVR